MRSGRCGDEAAVGKTQEEPFQLSFNDRLKAGLSSLHITSGSGLLLVQKLFELLSLSAPVGPYLADR
jgi:hypothetical protein